MKPRILIIEDHSQSLYLARYLLEANGYEILQAEDGKSGLVLAETSEPDLILLDISLPMMDGITVADRIRATGPGFQVPIVAMTAHAMIDDRDKIMQTGFDGYISKPIDPDTFISEVRSFLAGEFEQAITP